MVLITTDPIDTHGAYDMIASKSAGSVLFHFAVVKAQEGKGGVTCHIEYDVAGDAENELRTIAKEIAGSRGIEDILLIRRIGRVGVGEIISLVAASSPSSEDAFAACKSGIGRLKKMRSIVKNEVCG
ncbi:MAG TPA: molybdenum cofactor biosynthesis protein MoaE [Geobacteraceae bacterium]|nr:molybdenum cofactor biosynthesis protein MoaE [Geobacteraceae bacterium]